ncbi:MAG: hypothetical protein ACHQ2Z_12685 [Elusimicrobiota bacterium]
MAAGLLVLLLMLPAPATRAAVARVEVAPVLNSIVSAAMPLSYSAPGPALIFTPGLTAGPMLSAPLSGPAAPPAAPTAAVVPAAVLSAAEAPTAAGQPGASLTAVAAAQIQANAVVKKIEATAAALNDGRSVPDLLARDYAVYKKGDIQAAADAMIAATDTKYRRSIINAVFSRRQDLQEKLIAAIAKKGDPAAWPTLTGILFSQLRTAFFLDRDPGARVAVSSRVNQSAALFLRRIADDPALPDAARNLARGVAARYLADDGLMTALAWARQEKQRVADGRRELAAEVAALPELAQKIKGPDVALSSEDLKWMPPGPDAVVPKTAGTGVWRRTNDLIKRSRDFKYRFAVFQLARSRWYASMKIPLSAQAASREKAQWMKAASSFANSLTNHEYIVDYTLTSTLRLNFAYLDGGIRGRLLHPPYSSIVLRSTPEGYLLQAAFETKIQDPAVVEAFRRSIEGYWTRVFPEKGLRRRFTTQVAVRVLGPEENFSDGSLRLVDGVNQSSAGPQQISLSRKFTFQTPAHEFGHVMGLPDEYVDNFIPEKMQVVDEQDRSSLMANDAGLLRTRHIVQLIEAMREAGRLQPLTPE